MALQSAHRVWRCGPLEVCSWSFLWWVTVAALGLHAVPVHAQPATNRAAAGGVTADLTSQLQAKLTQAQADLNRALASLSAVTNLPAGATAAEAIEYRSGLQRLVRNY